MENQSIVKTFCLQDSKMIEINKVKYEREKSNQIELDL
jgi:hypothetical protein